MNPDWLIGNLLLIALGNSGKPCKGKFYRFAGQARQTGERRASEYSEIITEGNGQYTSSKSNLNNQKWPYTAHRAVVRSVSSYQ